MGEAGENLFGFFFFDADAAVGDVEIDEIMAVFDLFKLDMDENLAVKGEFDGVIDEVGDDLADARGVAA